MKYILLAASLFFYGSVAAQTLPTGAQNDSAIIVGRGLVSAKLADMKAAASNNAASFITHAKQYETLMQTGMMQRGRKLDTDPKPVSQVNFPDFLKIENNFAEYRKLVHSPQPDRTEIIKKAELFKSLY